MKSVESARIPGIASLYVRALLVLAFPLGALWVVWDVSTRDLPQPDRGGASAIQMSSAVRAEIQKLTVHLLAADTSMHNHLLTGSDSDLLCYRQARESFLSSLARIEKLNNGNLDELEHVHRVSNLADHAFDALSDLRQYSAIPGVTLSKPPGAPLQDAQTATRSVLAELSGLQDADSRWLARASAQSKPAQARQESIAMLAGALGLGGGLIAIYCFLGAAFQRERMVTRQMSRNLAQSTRELMVGNSRLRAEISDCRKAVDSERRVAGVFREVLNELNDGVIVVNQQGKYLYYNPAVERIFGRDIAFAEPSGWESRYGLPDDSPLLRAARGHRLDGARVETPAPVAVTARPMTAANGDPCGAFMILQAAAAPSLQPLLVREVLEEAVALVQDQAMQKKLNLRAAIGPAWELPVAADRGRLKQNLNKLLAAIIQSSDEGGSITISCTRTPSDSLRLEFAASLPPSTEKIELPLAADLSRLAASLNADGSTMKIVHPA